MEKDVTIRWILADLCPGFSPRVQVALEKIYVARGGAGPISREEIAEQLWRENSGDLRMYIFDGENESDDLSSGDSHNVSNSSDFYLDEDRVDKLGIMISTLYKHRSSLIHLSGSELAEISRRHALKYADSREALAHSLDNERFFSFPEADANTPYWNSLPSWGIEEATALSMGKEPSVVNEASIARDEVEGPSAFKTEFRRRFDVMKRALGEDSTFRAAPVKYTEWFRKCGISMTANKSTDDSRLALLLTAAEEEIASLKNRLSSYEEDLSSVNPKSKYTIYKLFLMMAAGRYKHRFAGYTHATRIIAKQFEGEKILRIDVGTVKACLDSIAAEPAMEEVVNALRLATET